MLDSEDDDFEVFFDGSVALLTPLSEDALAWAEEHIAGPTVMFGNAYHVEPRYLGPLLEGIEAAGMSCGDA